jgi:hypothetical protein
MEPMEWVVLVAVAVVALALGAALAWYFGRKRKSTRLKKRFGPEYDTVVSETGDRALAEEELRRRKHRVEKLHIKPLPDEARARYADEWRAVQSEFVDHPASAVAAADDLVERVMEVRGSPMADFDTRAADVSVDHPGVVKNYREGHALAMRAKRGSATTEDLRQAMVHYRALFEDLVERRVTNGMSREKRVEARR